MKFINNIFSPLLKAVASLANNDGPFKKRKRTPFDLKTLLGLNRMPGILGI